MDDNRSIPTHVAIIMDGNGRWAGSHGMNRLFGHKRGVEAVRSSVEAAVECGVKYLTLYAFSTENWGRPEDEVVGIMTIITKALLAESSALHKQGIRILFIGDKSQLDDKLQRAIADSEALTSGNQAMTLAIALNYSSRAEIISAVKSISQKVASGQMNVDDIDAESFSSHLYTAGMAEPDLMIRTSGERRISNFLLWQMAYTELYFTDVMWPEFTKEEFKRAIEEYSKRKRRFGAL